MSYKASLLPGSPLMNILAVIMALHLDINFKITLSSSSKNPVETWTGTAVNL